MSDNFQLVQTLHMFNVTMLGILFVKLASMSNSPDAQDEESEEPEDKQLQSEEPIQTDQDRRVSDIETQILDFYYDDLYCRTSNEEQTLSQKRVETMQKLVKEYPKEFLETLTNDNFVSVQKLTESVINSGIISNIELFKLFLTHDPYMIHTIFSVVCKYRNGIEDSGKNEIAEYLNTLAVQDKLNFISYLCETSYKVRSADTILYYVSNSPDIF